MKVYELLAVPARWTKYAFARDKYNTTVKSTDEDACKWCLGGAIIKCYENQDNRIEIVRKLNQILRESFISWNDYEETTHKKVIDVCKKLDI